MTTFKLIAPFIDPVTRNKIKFINKNDSSKAEKGGDVISVEECIPLDTMEVDLGGKYNFGFDIDTYWPELLEKTGNPYKFIDYR